MHNRLRLAKQRYRLNRARSRVVARGDQFVEVEIDDRLQCLAGSTLLKVFGQSLEPLRVLALQDDEFRDGCRWWTRECPSSQ